MPKVKVGISEEEKRLTDDIRAKYGFYINACNVGRLMGVRDYHTYMEWLSDLPQYVIGKRTKYAASDIAHKLMEARVI